MLEYLSGLHIERMEAEHQRELEDWQQKYQQSKVARESSIDSIARGMAELAAASAAPATIAIPQASITSAKLAPPALQQQAPQSGPLVEIAEDDMAKCTNCKSCYQTVSELFEKTRILVDGSAQEVGRVIPGVLDKVQLTSELIQRASRAANECDAEIIRFHQPD